MKGHPVAYSRSVITELMVPSYTNFGGKVHGGTLMSLMDKLAYVCASKHTNTCYFTMVAKDADGSTAEVPPLILESEEDVRRFCSALQRRRIREEGVSFMTDYKSSFTDHYAVADLLSGERCVLSISDSRDS